MHSVGTEYTIKAKCSNCGCIQTVPYPKGETIRKSPCGHLIDVRKDQSKGYILFKCDTCECSTLRECLY